MNKTYFIKYLPEIGSFSPFMISCNVGLCTFCLAAILIITINANLVNRHKILPAIFKLLIINSAFAVCSFFNTGSFFMTSIQRENNHV